eukprot:m.116019 g.116019  ORF g.116019 m.116019 type:complete len:316 (+) comp9492_c0_seq1:55-1002(+)
MDTRARTHTHGMKGEKRIRRRTRSCRRRKIRPVPERKFAQCRWFLSLKLKTTAGKGRGSQKKGLLLVVLGQAGQRIKSQKPGYKCVEVDHAGLAWCLLWDFVDLAERLLRRLGDIGEAICHEVLVQRLKVGLGNGASALGIVKAEKVDSLLKVSALIHSRVATLQQHKVLGAPPGEKLVKDNLAAPLGRRLKCRLVVFKTSKIVAEIVKAGAIKRLLIRGIFAKEDGCRHLLLILRALGAILPAFHERAHAARAGASSALRVPFLLFFEQLIKILQVGSWCVGCGLDAHKTQHVVELDGCQAAAALLVKAAENAL